MKKLNFIAFLTLGAWMILLSSCAPIRFSGREGTFPAKDRESLRQNIVTDSETFLGRKFIKVGGKYFRSDCSGFVQAIYFKNGAKVVDEAGPNYQNSVRNIYDFIFGNGTIYREGTPKPGDIVFFSNTLRKSSPYILSHLGIVEKVDSDGTITFIHKSSFGIIRDKLNLKLPSKRKNEDNGKIYNSYMRKRRAGDPPKTKYFAGELFEAYGNIIDPKSRENKEEILLPEPVVEEPDQDTPVEEAPVVEEK